MMSFNNFDLDYSFGFFSLNSCGEEIVFLEHEQQKWWIRMNLDCVDPVGNNFTFNYRRIRHSQQPADQFQDAVVSNFTARFLLTLELCCFLKLFLSATIKTLLLKERFLNAARSKHTIAYYSSSSSVLIVISFRCDTPFPFSSDYSERFRFIFLYFFTLSHSLFFALSSLGPLTFISLSSAFVVYPSCICDYVYFPIFSISYSPLLALQFS